MHCLRHLAILAVLVPMPSTSPFLLLLVVLVAYMAVRPCGYCLITLVVAFLATSPSSPFLAALAPEQPVVTTPSPSPPEPTPLSAPIPDRGAFFMNGGRIFDPALVGYTEMQQAWVDPPNDSPPAESAPPTEANSSSGSSSSSLQENHAIPKSADPKQKDWWSFKRRGATPSVHPPVPPARPLPPGYYDLRIGGVGFVLDFGWRRTDEGLAFELEEHKHAADVKRYRRAERQRRQGVKGGHEKMTPLPTPPPQENQAAQQGTGGSWMKASFVDIW